MEALDGERTAAAELMALRPRCDALEKEIDKLKTGRQT